MKGYLQALINPEFRLEAVKVALAIGTLLFLINHGSALLEGTMTLNRWLAGMLTYIVPYCVNIQGRYASHAHPSLTDCCESRHAERV